MPGAWFACALTTLGLTCGRNMPTGGCEVQAEQPSDPPAYPVRFKGLLDSSLATTRSAALPLHALGGNDYVDLPPQDVEQCQHLPDGLGVIRRV